MGNFDALDAWEDKPAAASRGGDFDALDAWNPPAAKADMGPEARRARGGGYPRPRDVTSEEAGADAGPITSRVSSPLPGLRYSSPEQARELAALGPGEEVRVTDRFPGTGHGVLGQFGQPKTLHVGQAQGEMTDPLVQMGTATALGMTAGVPFQAIPGIGAMAGPAIEGGVANKSMGGDFTTGAALGAIPAAIKPVVRAAAGGGERLISDVTKGKVRPAQALREELGRGHIPAGEPNLDEVLTQTPEARYAIKVQARTNPAKATKTLNKVIDKATEANDVDFAQIQRQHGGVPLVDVTGRLERLEAKLNAQGDGVAADATARFRNDLLKRYGTSGKVTADLEVSPQLKLGAQQIRKIRNNIGDTAFGGGFKDIEANTRRGAAAKIYREVAAAIEDVAANTSKVDLDALRLRNRQISTLTPVRDALQDRVDLAIDQEHSILHRLKGAPGDAARHGARALDYGLDQLPSGMVPSPAATAPLIRQRNERREQPAAPRKRRPDEPLASEP